jgi:hypothetical protein
VECELFLLASKMAYTETSSGLPRKRALVIHNLSFYVLTNFGHTPIYRAVDREVTQQLVDMPVNNFITVCESSVNNPLNISVK